MRGTENTHPLKKNDIHDSDGALTYHAPAKVVVRKVVASSNKLRIHGLCLIVILLSLMVSLPEYCGHLYAC